MLPNPALPSAVADVLAAAQGLAAAAGTGAGPVGAEERAAWLSGLRQIVDAAEAVFTHVLDEFDSAGDGQTLHGAASTASWLRGALGLAGGEAAERVRIARAARAELAPALSALADPAHPASYDHVRAVHRTVRALPPSVRDDAATHLTTLAGQLGVDDLRSAGRHLRHVVDPDGSARTPRRTTGAGGSASRRCSTAWPRSPASWTPRPRPS